MIVRRLSARDRRREEFKDFVRREVRKANPGNPMLLPENERELRARAGLQLLVLERCGRRRRSH